MARTTSNDRFTRADYEDRYRMIWAGYGEHGTGKTSFGLHAPGPIYVQSFDWGLEGVVNKFQKEKDIFVREYDWSPGAEGLSQDDAIALRDEFIEDFNLAVKKGRTILWDKETEVWELFRYAEFGAPNDAPRNYPELNQRYRHLLRRAMVERTDLNFGIIQSVKEKWVSKMKRDGSGMQAHNTGELVRAGFGELGNMIHVDIWHQREGGKIIANIGKCRQNSEMQDTAHDITVSDDVPNPFAFVAQLVFPDSSEEDWQ